MTLEELEQLHKETVQFYENRVKTHPILEKSCGKHKKILAQKIASAWNYLKEYVDWEEFVEVSTIFLEQYVWLEENHVTTLTDDILTYIHFTLLDYGIEVNKIRNGTRIKTTQGEIRNLVMNMVIKENVLEHPVDIIKIKIYSQLRKANIL